MSRTITICGWCGTTFEKRTADYNKQRRKNPDCKFFCTQSCHGKRNVAHLEGLHNFADHPEKQMEATAKARITNRKYFGRNVQFSTLLRKCKSRGKDFDLSLEILAKVWDAQGGRCALSNIPLDLNSTSYVYMPSVDRIDSSIGYVESNIQFVSCSLNLAKSSMSNDDALELIRVIYENYKSE